MSGFPLRLLVVDDHPVVRAGVVALLEREPDLAVVAEAADGETAVQLYALHQPDVAILDLGLPGMSGVDAIVAIRGRFPAARIVVLTVFDGDEDIYRALEAGARAYLLKDTSREELLATVRAVAAGLRRIPPPVAERLAQRMSSTELTRREAEILALIVEGRGNKQIGATLGIGEGTVKTHVNRLLAKLGVADRTEAAVTAIRRGLVRAR
jgi:DNA-binding NarL/FixJ family response regulator